MVAEIGASRVGGSCGCGRVAGGSDMTIERKRRRGAGGRQ